MRYLVPGIKSVLLVVLATTAWYLAFHYLPASPGWQPPLHILLVDTLTLIVHEAGHFFFRPFGDILYFMGGSLFQVLFPLGIGVYVWLHWREHTVYPLYWAGWSLCNAAVYISDAPFRMLHLIGRGTLHDWHTIFTRLDMLDDAVLIGALTHWTGVLVMAAALGMGGWMTVRDFRYA